jgi:hypothetical protein
MNPQTQPKPQTQPPRSMADRPRPDFRALAGPWLSVEPKPEPKPAFGARVQWRTGQGPQTANPAGNPTRQLANRRPVFPGNRPDYAYAYPHALPITTRARSSRVGEVHNRCIISRSLYGIPTRRFPFLSFRPPTFQTLFQTRNSK